MASHARSTRSSARLQQPEDDHSEYEAPRTRSSTRSRRTADRVPSSSSPLPDRSKQSVSKPVKSLTGPRKRKENISTRRPHDLLDEIDSGYSDTDEPYHANHQHHHHTLDSDSDEGHSDNDNDISKLLNTTTDSAWHGNDNLHLQFNSTPIPPSLQPKPSFRQIDANNDDSDTFDEFTQQLYPPVSTPAYHSFTTPGPKSSLHGLRDAKTPHKHQQQQQHQHHHQQQQQHTRCTLPRCTVYWILLALFINVVIMLYVTLRNPSLQGDLSFLSSMQFDQPHDPVIPSTYTTEDGTYDYHVMSEQLRMSSSEIEQLRKQIDQMNATHVKDNESLTTLRARITELEQENAVYQKDANNLHQLQQQVTALEKKNQSCIADASKFTEIQQQFDELQQQYQTCTQRVSDIPVLEHRIKELSQANASCTTDSSDDTLRLQKLIKELDDANTALKAAAVVDHEQIDTLGKRLTQVEHAHERCTEDFSKLQNLVNETSSALSVCQSEKKDIEGLYQQVKSELHEANQQILQLSKEDPLQVDKTLQLEEQYRVLKSDYDSCIQSLDEKDRVVNECQSITTKLQADLEMVQQHCDSDSEHDSKASHGHSPQNNNNNTSSGSDEHDGYDTEGESYDDQEQDGIRGEEQDHHHTDDETCNAKLNNCISTANAYKLLHNSTRQECREFVKSISKSHADTCTQQCIEVYHCNLHLYHHHNEDDSHHHHHHHHHEDGSCPYAGGGVNNTNSTDHAHDHHTHPPRDVYEITEHDDEGVVEIKTTRDKCIKTCETTAVNNLVHFTHDFGEDFDHDDQSDLRAHVQVNTNSHKDVCREITEELQEEVTNCVTRLIQLQTQHEQLAVKHQEELAIAVEAATKASAAVSTQQQQQQQHLSSNNTVDIDKESLISALSQLEKELTFVRSEVVSITNDFNEHQQEQSIIRSHYIPRDYDDIHDPLAKLLLPINPSAQIGAKTLTHILNILIITLFTMIIVTFFQALLPPYGIAKFFLALMWFGLALYLFISNMLISSAVAFGNGLLTMVVIIWPNTIAHGK